MMAGGQLTTTQVTHFPDMLRVPPISKEGLMQISAVCAACGSKMLVIPDEGEADQMVRCSECNADIGDKAAFTAKLREAAQKEADKIVQDMKKRLGKAFKSR